MRIVGVLVGIKILLHTNFGRKKLRKRNVLFFGGKQIIKGFGIEMEIK
jgi:hypothetical protein